MSSQVKLIVGLGNPGPGYAGTRHNAGFWFADLLARRNGGRFRSEPRFQGEVCRIDVSGRECRLFKPLGYMNRSGQGVHGIAHYFRLAPEEMLVAHDELDLPAGAIRLKIGGGHAGHNGLRDIISALGSQEFQRLRIGISHPPDREQVIDYVLARPSKADFDAIISALEDTADLLPEILDGSSQFVMNRLHVRQEK